MNIFYHSHFSRISSIALFQNICLFLLISFSSLAQPSGFQTQKKVQGSGSTGLFSTVGVTFDKAGQMYANEVSGKVWAIRFNASNVEQRYLILDISDEVLNNGDLGMVSMVLDPDFLINGYFYVMYAVNRTFLLTGQGGGDDASQSGSIVRVARYTANKNASPSFSSLVPNSRLVLVGTSPSDGIPILGTNHGGGCLLFGNDGTLLISTGDGSIVGNDTGYQGYYQEAINAGIITPAQNVGAYRSQMDNSLNGKVLRVNPLNGDGIASNPLYNTNAVRSTESRMWAKGLRNPFRMTLMPNTGGHHPEEGDPGVILVGDVGSVYREEINTITAAGQNFGWPRYEGIDIINYGFYDPTYIPASYRKPIFEFRDYSSQANVFLNQTTKLKLGTGVGNFFYNGPSPFSGNGVMMGDFYKGTTFPAKYQNALFFADFIGKWIRVMTFDANHEPATIENFMQLSDYITSIAYNPIDEALYYDTGNALPCDQIYKVSYSPSNTPPIAKIETDVNYGTVPFPVAFSAKKSYDLDATNLTYEWSIDGNPVFSTGLEPHYLFTTPNNVPQTYKVKLKVKDQNGTGLSSTDSVYIYANNTPPTIVSTSLDNLTTITPNQNYSLNLSASVTDAQSLTGDLTLTWTVGFAHNGHEHKNPPIIGNNVSTTLPAAICEVGDATYWYKVYLTVSDPQGLSQTIVRNIQLNCPGATQTITFNPIPNQEVNLNSLSSVVASATSSAGLNPLYYFSIEGAAYTIDNQIKLTGKPGRVTIRAVQHGNETYKPALPVDQTFEVDRTIVHYTMNFNTIPNKFSTDAPFTISATTSPTLKTPKYMLISGPATLSGNTVTLTGGVGSVKIRAYIEGDYSSKGVYVDRTFSVDSPPATQDEIIYGDALNVNWQNMSSISSLNMANTSPQFINTKSIKVSNPTLNETLDFRKNTSLNTTYFPYGIDFWVYNEGSSAFPFQVQSFETSTTGGSTMVSLTAFPQKWTHHTLSWAALGNPPQVGKVLIKLNQSQAESLYFDEIKLLFCNNIQTVKTGNWSDTSVWSCGRVPVATDNVTINAGHTVTLLNGQSGTLNLLNLVGTLNKQTESILTINNY